MLKKYRDLLALLLGVIVIPAIWVMQGLGVIELAGVEVLGATIVIETMIAQFYFRKKPTAENTDA